MHKENEMSLVKAIKHNWARIAATVMVLGTVVAPLTAEAATRDCVSNSIEWCGAMTKSEWVNKVHNGDGHNTAANIQKIYFHEGRGITEADFKSSATVDGTVYKDGRVVVNGKTVATGGKSIGRSWQPGAVKSGSVWMTPNQNAFLSGSISAWVDMSGGKFHWFILKSCGNAGVATPVATPKPSPTPTPKPSPSPVKSFECVILTPSRPDATKPNHFRFTVTPKVKNVTITGFHFNFSDHTATDTAANKPFVERDVATGKGLTVHAQVKTNAGTTKLSDACSATVSVTEETPTPTPTPTPTSTPQVLGVTTLVQTGPEAALGGIAGLSAIGWASRNYIRSRKSLLDAMRNKRTDR
jgi:hypothetical protein